MALIVAPLSVQLGVTAMGRPATQPRPPRPADIAIAGNRMLTGLLRRIFEMNYRRLAPNNMGTALVLMMINFRVVIATADGMPLTITELAKITHMPPASVRRHVDMLVRHHRVKLIASRKRGRGEEKVIVSELDYLDGKITLEHLDASIVLMETCLAECKRLRPLLMDQLVCNGKKQAAE